MTQPRLDFFVIGAARSGTTSIFKSLIQHPNVFSPEIKEPRFFCGTNEAKGWGWYASNYAEAEDDEICGDFSPSYTFASNSVGSPAKKIFDAYPDAKLICIVRNPIECAISNWRMHAEISGQELPFADALEQWRARLVFRCQFLRQYSYFSRWFPEQSIFVIPLEVIKRKPEPWMYRAQLHLGLEPIKLTFPNANKSDWKPNRPGVPAIPIEARKEFLSLVETDAKAFLDRFGFGRRTWDLSTDSQAWQQPESQNAGPAMQIPVQPETSQSWLRKLLEKLSV